MNIKYFPISTGKLRYFSIENAIDFFFRFTFGIIQSMILLFPLRKNSLVFSTGGFVALPVVIASKLLGIKSIIHEQTAVADWQIKFHQSFAIKYLLVLRNQKKTFPPTKQP